MLGRIASIVSSRAGALWERLPGEAWRGPFGRYAPVAASVAVNGLLLLALTAFASGAAHSPPEPITIALMSDVPPRAVAMPPPPKPKAATPPRPRSSAPAASPGAETAPPLTLPDAEGNEPGVETIPADTGTLSPSVPKGLQKFLEADPCIDASTRRLHPECKSTLRAAAEAIPDRQARADRAERVAQMEKDLGLYDNCQSSHMGCAAASDRTLAGAAQAKGATGTRTPMGAGGPTGMPGPDLQRPNAYHVDPGFGD